MKAAPLFLLFAASVWPSTAWAQGPPPPPLALPSSLTSFLGGHANFILRLGGFLVMKVFAIATSIAIFFLIYWVLPNGKVPARAVLPAAVIMGLLSESLKYVYIWALPLLNFQEVYGPFALSVTLMFWAFLSGLLLLTGAQLSVQGHRRSRR